MSSFTGLKSSESFTQGESISDPEFRKKLNEAAALAASFGNLDTDLPFERGPGYSWIGAPPQKSRDLKIVAKITGVSVSDPGLFSWKQVWRDSATAWINQTDGLYEGSVSSFPMREINDNFVPEDTIVEAWIEPIRGTGEPQWVCEYNTGVKVVQVREDSDSLSRGADFLTTATITYEIWNLTDDPDTDPSLATLVEVECARLCDTLTLPAPDDSLGIAVAVPDGAGSFNWKLLHVCERTRRTCQTYGVKVREDSTVAARGEDLVTTAAITYSIWRCEDDPAIATPLDTEVSLECNGKRDDLTEYVPAPDDSLAMVVDVEDRPDVICGTHDFRLMHVCEKRANPHICCDLCPTDCDSCPANINATLAGFATAACACLHGAHSMARTACQWQFSGGPFGAPCDLALLTITLNCTGKKWRIHVLAQSLGTGSDTTEWEAFVDTDGSGCPPSGTFNLAFISGTVCSGDTPTVAI